MHCISLRVVNEREEDTRNHITSKVRGIKNAILKQFHMKNSVLYYHIWGLAGWENVVPVLASPPALGYLFKYHSNLQRQKPTFFVSFQRYKICISSAGNFLNIAIVLTSPMFFSTAI